MKRLGNIVLALVLTGSFITAAQQNPATLPAHLSDYAGDWWRSASSEERNGFLAGIDDCLTWDVRKPLHFDESWEEFEKVLSQFYEPSHNLHIPVFDVVRVKLGLRHRSSPARPVDYGHDWWRHATSLARRGFIEGLTSCRIRSKHIRSKHNIVWDTPADECVHRFDSIFGVDRAKEPTGDEYQGAVTSAYERWCSDGLFVRR